MLLQEITPPL